MLNRVPRFPNRLVSLNFMRLSIFGRYDLRQQFLRVGETFKSGDRGEYHNQFRE